MTKIILFLDETNHGKKNNVFKKNLVLITSILSGVLILSSLFFTSVVGEEHQVELNSLTNTGYFIQNLKGDTIDTHLSWRLVDGDTLYVNILNGEKHSEKIELIKSVLLSGETIEIDNSLLHKGPEGTMSTYYLGWKGALEAASEKQDTELFIPINIELINSKNGEGDITIELSNFRNGDGYSGWTKSITDDTQNQILKSHIVIFETDNLSDSQFKTILRHELGHAFGLAHSTAPEDLMYPSIETDFPYISDCTIDAIIHLYDGGTSSEVICQI
ncbi:peptidase M10A and M12B matrixin and adamalysin [Candidatus Nitrosopumilus koreensis AR1]|uniref:Peptidase M10A and M12B matrixin and adamalysin n=1 Tax=Candidatus Nitrosopumilus koreensis AR1 TaxID=1229908 RepID=K0BA77_9ARCH|nr:MULTISPECIES: matrixin family metalloprotease [Nitrosopumilus]AFS81351.1 peptidase M10A and M12B matrixin and adamalysin [Candidatus Nitrosopumilus koreensis AR1]